MTVKNKKKNLARIRRDAAREVRRQQRLDRLRRAACGTADQALDQVEATREGLDTAEVAVRRARWGANRVTREKQKSLPRRLAGAFVNPFTAILLALAAVSAVTDMLLPALRLAGTAPEAFDGVTVAIILGMVGVSGVLRFVQESRSGSAAEKLLALITTTCTVQRDGEAGREIPLEDVVVGDIVRLQAGDMVPADLRILEARDLFVSQAGLTGESEPVEKRPAPAPDADAVTDCACLAFLGTNVISGSAVGVALAVGDDTLFGSATSAVAGQPAPTSFVKGVNAVSWVLIRFMLVMVPVVFFLNGFTKGDWMHAFLFGVSVAVGLTPEMLPMIVTTCLARGAVAMSRKRTVVKNLNAIQNFGAMDLLCTDKTGTLTQDRVALQYSLDALGNEDERVLRCAYLNSRFQTGYRNLMDRAVIRRIGELAAEDPAFTDPAAGWEKVDEIPFTFSRRRLTVVVRRADGGAQMVTKGAVEEMLAVCTRVECGEGPRPLTGEVRQAILRTADRLNEQGFRVLAVAQKADPAPAGALGPQDERDMVLLGYLAFLDPPKESAAGAIAALGRRGVEVRVLTGDNEKVARTVCRQVGLPVQGMLLGGALDRMSDDELARAARTVRVFAKLSPEQKARVVSALRADGHTVGFLGDGINDAAAMKAADVGISVDTAVDVAKESADIILLEKDLTVLEQGVTEGRKTYANMIKYIKMTASSNFGNMFSVLAASALLPFLPMESLQLLLLNLIYDLCCTAIPWDNVDEEFLARPRRWDASSVGGFMLWMGPASSVFDLLTYLFLYFVLCPAGCGGMRFSQLETRFAAAQLAQMKASCIALFQTGWFVESMWSQTLVIHMIRTPGLPFFQSRASAPLTGLTALGIGAVTLLPFTPLAPALGFAALPPLFFAYLVPCILLYMALATVLKKAYIRRHGALL